MTQSERADDWVQGEYGKVPVGVVRAHARKGTHGVRAFVRRYGSVRVSWMKDGREHEQVFDEPDAAEWWIRTIVARGATNVKLSDAEWDRPLREMPR